MDLLNIIAWDVKLIERLQDHCACASAVTMIINKPAKTVMHSVKPALILKIVDHAYLTPIATLLRSVLAK